MHRAISFTAGRAAGTDLQDLADLSGLPWAVATKVGLRHLLMRKYHEL